MLVLPSFLRSVRNNPQVNESPDTIDNRWNHNTPFPVISRVQDPSGKDCRYDIASVLMACPQSYFFRKVKENQLKIKTTIKRKAIEKFTENQSSSFRREPIPHNGSIHGSTSRLERSMN
jgi:hypothetical protein